MPKRKLNDIVQRLHLRDIASLIWRDPSTISMMRSKWETDQNTVLPHTGTVQDFGSCITHKTAIVRKVVYEAKDPCKVADETKHSQQRLT